MTTPQLALVTSTARQRSGDIAINPHSRSSCKRSSGLTLVETVIVIAIIAVLAALTGLGISAGRRQALRSVSLSNLAQIGKASLLYAADHDNYISPHLTKYGQIPDGEDEEHLQANLWRNDLLPYTKTKEVFFSPIDPFAKKARNPTDVPNGDIRGITSFLHDSRLARFFAEGQSMISLEVIPDTSSAWHLHESAKSFVKDLETGLIYEVPIADDSVGVLFMDGHTKRMPWSPPTAKK